MNTNKILIKLLSTLFFAALIASCLVTSLNMANANPLDRIGGGAKDLDMTPPPGGGLDLPRGVDGAGSLLGSNNYLIIAIAGIVIVAVVLLIAKFVMPKLKAK
jgi:hypothetical protein